MAHPYPARRVERACLMILAAVALIYLLDVAAAVAAPITLALVTGIVLSPLTRLWLALRLPGALAALLTLLVALVVAIAAMFLLEPIVSRVIARAPLIWYELRETVEQLKAMLRGLDQVAEDVASAIDAEPGSDDEDAVAIPTATEALAYAPGIAAQALIFIGTLFFFLFARVETYTWLGRVIPGITAERFDEAERTVARYFLTITIINACFGVLVAIGLSLIGMPSPILWGVIGFLMNFLLYLGPTAVTAALAVAGIVVFDGPASFLPPLIFAGLNMIEGQFVTPTLVGRTMSVNPLLVFLSLTFWLWLWGPLGGIIALPLLLWTMEIAWNGRAPGTDRDTEPEAATG
ncbi:AI-2E family transporter [Oceanomicrobium pacificus]|uniref:AI-2E family transporter n=1 Tax=Oceanomicrobium pacificus TaxID=2692916 RepID=A0A6B0TM98_9RHOB|nr:AI-2E family transporter [Oceanomicrobium pacificus]MXU65690.1 AI-2E family transporter [Oceanomicrobium pacificus]